MWRKLVGFIGMTLLVLNISLSCGKTEGNNEKADVKQNNDATESIDKDKSYPKAPDFRLKDLDGNVVRLSDFSGKMIILDFWATWCPPCRAEIPHFIELYDEYKDKGLEIIGISTDQGGKSVVKEFVKNNNIDYPILMYTMDVIKDFGGIRGIPTTFIINKKGQIVDKYVGYKDKEVFEKEVQQWLINDS